MFPDFEKRACRGADTNIFYIERSGARSYDTARAICASCRAIVPCRDYALANEEYGFWGGTSPAERVAIRGFHIPDPELDLGGMTSPDV
jgi:hypothetical protein